MTTECNEKVKALSYYEQEKEILNECTAAMSRALTPIAENFAELIRAMAKIGESDNAAFKKAVKDACKVIDDTEIPKISEVIGKP